MFGCKKQNTKILSFFSFLAGCVLPVHTQNDAFFIAAVDCVVCLLILSAGFMCLFTFYSSVRRFSFGCRMIKQKQKKDTRRLSFFLAFFFSFFLLVTRRKGEIWDVQYTVRSRFLERVFGGVEML